MSFTLGNITLPNPKGFQRNFQEVSQVNTTIQGVTKKKIDNRKEVFRLLFQHLTQAQLNSILSEYELKRVRSFTVNEEFLSIGPTDVLIDIQSLEYPPSGKLWRSDLELVLTEVR